MSKREGLPAWWRIFYHQRAVIDSVSDAEAGRALKAAMQYFDGETVDISDLQQGAYTVFCVLKVSLDESIADYRESVESGRIGAQKRWRNK